MDLTGRRSGTGIRITSCRLGQRGSAMSDYDVVVVGSGAGGGTCAWKLAANGVRVLLLEAGPAYDPYQDYRLHRNDWEAVRFPTKMPATRRYTFAPMQELESRWSHLRSWTHVTGQLVKGKTRKPGTYHHVLGLGGSTLHFQGEAHRLHPDAMRMQSRFGVAADWPLKYEDLEPFYLEAESLVGVAGPADTGARWRSAPYPLPPHGLGYASQKLADACKTLGLSWQPNSLAILSRPFDDRPPCNYCNNCHRGCPRRDKGSIDVTYIAKARATGRCTIRTGCRVLRVEAGKGDRVSGLVYRDAQGSDHKVKARAYVIACGTIETPRLLLASEDGNAPHGLANESGLVGRNLMESLSWASVGLHPEPLGSYRGVPADGICWDFNAPDAVSGVPGGIRLHHGTVFSDLLGPIAYSKRVVGEGWGREHKLKMRDRFGRAVGVGGLGEFLPNPRTYVDLDPNYSDQTGLPLPRIHSYVADTDLKRLEFIARTTQRILEAAGVDQVLEKLGTYDRFNTTHVFGTCRMGEDPESSVVDGWGRNHRWRNLYVMDASVFPSSGGGESPSLTIQALSLRNAERLTTMLSGRDL